MHGNMVPEVISTTLINFHTTPLETTHRVVSTPYSVLGICEKPGVSMYRLNPKSIDARSADRSKSIPKSKIQNPLPFP
ncbi:hypothetical protein NIES3974_38960 [Calothrix sp. NIES-3974]|nr:hypothetical protein NIES3974_38960 [Calothrix sp. NIES-3974]